MRSPRLTRAASALGLALGAAGANAAAACSGTHGGLGVEETSSQTTGAGTGSGGSGSATSGASSGSFTGGGGSGGEPFDGGRRGPTELTVVNGVNDHEAIRLCFLPYPAGDPAAVPWPAAPGGLGFARSAVVDPLDDVVPIGSDVRITIVTGDLALAAGETCAEIIAAASPPDADPDAGGGLAVAELPVLPASVWESGKSLLLVPNGCLGGPAHTSPSEQLACGFGYTPSSPTVGLVVLGMSRATEPGALALQIVHAAVPLMPSDFRITAQPGAFEQPIAANLALGGAAPVPPFTGLAKLDLLNAGEAVIKTYFPNDTYPTSAIALAEVFAHGDLASADLADGQGYALVAVGGYPGVPGSEWWHGMTYALVRTDP